MVTNPKGTSYDFDKYEEMHHSVVSKNYCSSGMLITLIKVQTVSILSTVTCKRCVKVFYGNKRIGESF